MDPSQQSTAEHLCVLVHGLWGNPDHLKYLKETLQAQHLEEKLHILVSKSNADSFTYDGIEVGGERITNEVEQTVKELEQDGAKIKKISIVGYSLGGLVSRYAIGLMYKNGLFDNIQPMNFTTFATPHLGIRTPKLGYRAYMWNSFGSRTLSTSGQQMFTMDNFRDSGRPLLSILADQNSIFMKGLRLFKNRSLYANTINDRSVPFYTAGVSRTDPFVDLEKIDLHHLPDQELPVILSPEHPVSPRKARRKSELEALSLYGRLGLLSQQTTTTLPFYALFFTLMPIAIPTFLINSAIQTYRSTRRIKFHESGQAGISLGRYRIPLLEEAQAAQDRAYEHVAADQSAEYLPTPPPESMTASRRSSGSSTTSAKKLARRESRKETSEFPILALTEEQFQMIENLDELGFEKFPVHISKHRHTHAAIVVRIQKDVFAEGKVVVAHWAGKFEV